MFTNIVDYLLHLIFYRGRQGKVHFDLFQDPTGRHMEPDGYLMVRQQISRNDDRDQAEKSKLIMLSFTLENRWEARKLTRALALHIQGEALLQGLSPVRLVWHDEREVTPFDGIERAPLIQSDHLVSMPRPGLPTFIFAG
jgi:hypothetical protein